MVFRNHELYVEETLERRQVACEFKERHWKGRGLGDRNNMSDELVEM